MLNGNASFTLQGTFPDSTDTPATISKGQILLMVPLDVPPDLLPPKNLLALRPAEQMAIMAVPETPMNEYNGFAPVEYKIRFSWKVFAVQPKSESAPV
tara:strand:- start:9860 stop:10153 length:294 start_codon:yes stop_codon:yes gene_type:complete